MQGVPIVLLIRMKCGNNSVKQGLKTSGFCVRPGLQPQTSTAQHVYMISKGSTAYKKALQQALNQAHSHIMMPVQLALSPCQPRPQERWWPKIEGLKLLFVLGDAQKQQVIYCVCGMRKKLQSVVKSPNKPKAVQEDISFYGIYKCQMKTFNLHICFVISVFI